MSRLVEFPLKDGGTVVVEVDESTGGPVRAARPGEVAQTATKTFDDATSGLRAIAERVIDQVRDVGPETVEVEFSIKFNAEAGVVLAKAASEGACKVKLAWKPKTAA